MQNSLGEIGVIGLMTKIKAWAVGNMDFDSIKIT